MLLLWLITSVIGAVIMGTIAYQTADRYVPWYFPLVILVFGFIFGPLICLYALIAALWWAYANIRISVVRIYRSLRRRV